MIKPLILDITRRLQAAGFYTPDSIDVIEPKESKYEGRPKVYVAGNSVFEHIELKHGQQVLNFGSMIVREESGNIGNVFAPPPLLTYNKSKNIDITVIDGTDAEVVERYGDGQWDIGLEGILVDMDEHTFPIQKIKTLRSFFEIPDAIEVTSDILNTGMNVFSIFFTDFQLNGVAGYSDTFYYSLKGRSIKPTEFYLNNEVS